jgi:hypothetical protein
MTEYKNCKRCGNENYAYVYTCDYCGLIYCDSCRKHLPRCSKNTHQGTAHSSEEIGYISGFCDVCRKSLYQQDVYTFDITELSSYRGHKECLERYFKSDEGKVLIIQTQAKDKKEIEKIRNQEEKEKERKRIEEENIKKAMERNRRRFRRKKIIKTIFAIVCLIILCFLIYKCFIN